MRHKLVFDLLLLNIKENRNLYLGRLLFLGICAVISFVALLKMSFNEAFGWGAFLVNQYQGSLPIFILVFFQLELLRSFPFEYRIVDQKTKLDLTQDPLLWFKELIPNFFLFIPTLLALTNVVMLMLVEAEFGILDRLGLDWAEFFVVFGFLAFNINALIRIAKNKWVHEDYSEHKRYSFRYRAKSFTGKLIEQLRWSAGFVATSVLLFTVFGLAQKYNIQSATPDIAFDSVFQKAIRKDNLKQILVLLKSEEYKEIPREKKRRYFTMIMQRPVSDDFIHHFFGLDEKLWPQKYCEFYSLSTCTGDEFITYSIDMRDDFFLNLCLGEKAKLSLSPRQVDLALEMFASNCEQTALEAILKKYPQEYDPQRFLLNLLEINQVECNRMASRVIAGEFSQIPAEE